MTDIQLSLTNNIATRKNQNLYQSMQKVGLFLSMQDNVTTALEIWGS